MSQGKTHNILRRVRDCFITFSNIARFPKESFLDLDDEFQTYLGDWNLWECEIWCSLIESDGTVGPMLSTEYHPSCLCFISVVLSAVFYIFKNFPFQRQCSFLSTCPLVTNPWRVPSVRTLFLFHFTEETLLQFENKYLVNVCLALMSPHLSVTYTWRWATSLSMVTSCLTCRKRPWLLSTMLSRMSRDTCCIDASADLALTKLAIWKEERRE